MIKSIKSEERKKFIELLKEKIKADPERYKYFAFSGMEEIKNPLYEKIEFLSKDKDGNIRGEMGILFDIKADKVIALELISFKDNDLVFTKDFINFCKILSQYKRIELDIIPGSPSYSLAMKLFKKYNFRKVGTFKESVKLLDNKFYDVEYWERKVMEVGE